MLYLEHLLAPFGFTSTSRVKLVRHQDSRMDVKELRRAGQFEHYQALQSRPVFDNCDMLVSFVGGGSTLSTFVGVYHLSGQRTHGVSSHPPGFIYPQWDVSQHFEYRLERDTRFESLVDRVVIDWGLGTRAWVQNFREREKAVVEVLPTGYVAEWPGYLDFVLRFDELSKMIENPIANREWHRMLSAVAGVYLIVDAGTGRQYVGSAYGERGILGRWEGYASSGHGGNVQLMDLLNSSPDAKRRLEFSVLQTLPKSLTAGEIIEHETFHKRKLGSRAHGLNGN